MLKLLKNMAICLCAILLFALHPVLAAMPGLGNNLGPQSNDNVTMQSSQTAAKPASVNTTQTGVKQVDVNQTITHSSTVRKISDASVKSVRRPVKPNIRSITVAKKPVKPNESIQLVKNTNAMSADKGFVDSSVLENKPAQSEPAPTISKSDDIKEQESLGEQDFLASLRKDEDKSKSNEESPFIITALSFLAKLAIVIALAYGCIFALKKFTNIKTGIAAKHQQVRVLENLSLGSNKSLHIVEIGSKKLLVASTPNSVNLITELDNTGIETTPAKGSSGFKEQLAGFLGEPTQSNDPGSNVSQMLRGSAKFLQDKVRDIAANRGKFRNA